MAAAWIKMCHGLAEKREVLLIAKAMRKHPFWVVGALHRLWCWADGETASGSLEGVGLEDIDGLVGVKGFGRAIEAAGWLEASPSGLRLVNFDRHNSEPAKLRAMGKNRAEKHRNRDKSRENDVSRNASSATKALREGGFRNASSATNALPEKRREEKKRTSPPPLRSGGDENAEHTHPAREGVGVPGQEAGGWALREWVAFVDAWNRTERAVPWTPLGPPDGWVDAAASPSWLDRAREAMARLPGCRFFERPLAVTRFLSDGYVDRILAGEFDQPKAPTRNGHNGKPLPDPTVPPF